MEARKQTIEELKEKGLVPEWQTIEGYSTLKGGYLLEGEEPRDMYGRIAKTVAAKLNKPELEEKFFDYMWKGWLCPASPVCSNIGTERGLPISCFSVYVGDSVKEIMDSMTELALLSKHGGGVGMHWNDVRERGSIISNGNGKSDGVVPFLKIQDSTTVGVSQGGVRRGASASYLSIEHGDAEEFLNIRKPQGDVNRQTLNTHHGFCISDEFMDKVLVKKDKKARELWVETLKTRHETGEPYMFFTDNVAKNRPQIYKDLNLDVKGSNICCVSGDTLVLTKEGPQRIDSLNNKTVEVWDGINWVKNSSFKQRGIDSLYRVHISDGSYVDCNLEHRWFVASSYEDIRKKKYLETKTKNLKGGQWIESHNTEVHGKNHVNGAYIKGFLIGDGTSVKDRPLLRLHSTKYMCGAKILSSLDEVRISTVNSNAIIDPSFSKEYEYKNSDAYGTQKLKNLKGLTVRKDELYEWVKNYKIKLPNEIYSWDKTSKLEFLAGLIDSDGTISKGCLQISSIHESFIKDVYLLLKTFGFHGNIDSFRSGMYRLSIGAQDSFSLLIEAPTQRVKFIGNIPNRKLTSWRRIVKIENLNKMEPVFCPELPTTGKFGLANGLMTGNTEIFLHTDKDHSFVCCLSSLNAAKYDEWKNSDLIYTSIWFLDGVMQEFIDKAKGKDGFERSVRFAEKSRALGLGLLGFHSLLQQRRLPFDHMDTFMLNAEIFRTMDKESLRASKDLTKEYGEPEWCKGYGVRNTHRIALAPTVSNSTISGNVSPSIEPWTANVFAKKSAKGTFITKNQELLKLLEEKGQNTEEVWNSITSNQGSVQHLDFLSQNEKEVFATAREINQFTIIKLAGQRQRWIDQGQSINIFFPSNVDPKYFHEIHVQAWKEGLNSLYYCRTSSPLKGDSGSRGYERRTIDQVETIIEEKPYFRSIDECKACEG